MLHISVNLLTLSQNLYVYSIIMRGQLWYTDREGCGSGNGLF